VIFWPEAQTHGRPYRGTRDLCGYACRQGDKATCAALPVANAANEAQAEALGVKRVSIPSHATKSVARKQRQKERWFKKGQKWRTGCEGRISVLKRRHGLERSRYKGLDGMKRYVGLGVIADNIIHIGTHLAAQASG
jgi:transposase, IS5 family